MYTKSTLLSEHPTQPSSKSADMFAGLQGKLAGLFRSLNPVCLKRGLDRHLETFWHLAVGNNPG